MTAVSFRAAMAALAGTRNTPAEKRPACPCRICAGWVQPKPAVRETPEPLPAEFSWLHPSAGAR